MWSRNQFAAFRRADRGVVAVEFALVALPFFTLVMGIVVLGFMLFCASQLDYATQKAARQIMVGTVQSGALSAAQFRSTVLCSNLPSPMFDCTKVVVNLKTVTAGPEPTAYYDLVKADRSGIVIPPLDNSQTSYCPGTGGAYEVMEVLYPIPSYLSLFSTTAQMVDGQFILISTAAFKNEPFQGSSAVGAGC